MDLSRTRVALRERAVVDVLDLAVRFVVEHAAIYGKTSLFVLAPFVALSFLIARTSGWLLAWTVAILAAPLAGAPFTYLASRLVFDDDASTWEAIKATLRQLGKLVLVRVVVGVVAIFGLSFLLLPGIWFLAVVLFATEGVILERATALGAIQRSVRMVVRESGEGLIALLLLAVLHFVAVLAADFGGRSIVALVFESSAPDPIWESGGSFLGLLGFWLFVPYEATARFLVYLDVRTRSEGWDIQTRFVALASRADAVPRSAA